MTRARLLVMTAVLLLPWMARAQGEDLSVIPKDAAPIATEALQTFAELITEENFAQLGFESPQQVRAARLGTPANQFSVQLDKLQSYDMGQEPRDLFTPHAQVVYPVLVKDVPHGSIELVEGERGWRVASFGARLFSLQVGRIRQEKALELHQPVSAFFLLRVPALSVYFLAHQDRSGLILTPILNDARFGFQAGTSLQASEAFRLMRPVARKTEDLPG
jgi:hypothetical protein